MLILLISLVSLFLSRSIVFGSVKVELKFMEFRNPTGRRFDGKKCESYAGSFSVCETYFKICVKMSNTIPTDVDDSCDYKKSSGSPFVRSDNVDFQSDFTGVTKTIRIQKSTWTGSIAFYMKVFDDDYGRDDVIDIHRYALPVTPGFNGVGTWNYQSTFGSRPNHKTELRYQVNVYCESNYYGANCRTFCQQHDDISGHYKCERNGNRVCNKNWYVLPNCLTSCIPRDDDTNGHFTCNINGSHVCRPNWYNLPSCKTHCKPQNDSINGHYECDMLGQKVCHLGWLGDNCTTYCIQSDNDSNGHYNCSKSGAKICHEKWYGPKCSNYCKESNDTIGGYYYCSSGGQKICAENYYGTNCTVFCLLSNNATGNFICDKQTGAKLCDSHWTGKYCNITMSSVILSTSADLLTTRLNSLDFTSSIVVSSSVPLMGHSSFISMRQSIIKTSTTERLSTTVWQTFYSTSSIAFDLLPTSSLVLPSKSKADTSRLLVTTTISSSMSAQLTTTPLVERTVTTSAVSPAATTTTTTRAATTTAIYPKPTPVPTTQKTSTKPTTRKPSKTPPQKTTGKPSKAPPKQTTEKPIKPTKPHTKFDPDNKGDASKIDKSTNTAKQSAQNKWLIETKEGRIVLFGSLFAFLMLIGVVIAVVMYLRSPKSPKFARKANKKAFEHLEESLEDVKLENLFEKSHFNPLYAIPIDELESKNKKSKRKGKLEKFYTKKDAVDDDDDDDSKFSNVHNSNGSFNATQSNLSQKNGMKISLDPDSFA